MLVKHWIYSNMFMCGTIAASKCEQTPRKGCLLLYIYILFDRCCIILYNIFRNIRDTLLNRTISTKNQTNGKQSKMNGIISQTHLENLGAIVAVYCQNNKVIAPGDVSKAIFTLENKDGQVVVRCTGNENYNIQFLKEEAWKIWEREHGTEKFYGQRVGTVLSNLRSSGRTMYHLVTSTESDLLKIRDCGLKVLNRIKEWIREDHELGLGMSFPEFSAEFEEAIVPKEDTVSRWMRHAEEKLFDDDQPPKGLRQLIDEAQG